MAAKDVIFGGEARARMVEGVNILANAVKVTLGLPRPATSPVTARPRPPCWHRPSFAKA